MTSDMSSSPPPSRSPPRPSSAASSPPPSALPCRPSRSPSVQPPTLRSRSSRHSAAMRLLIASVRPRSSVLLATSMPTSPPASSSESSASPSPRHTEDNLRKHDAAGGEDVIEELRRKVEVLKRSNVRLQAKLQMSHCLTPQAFSERDETIKRLKEEVEGLNDKCSRLKIQAKIASDRLKRAMEEQSKNKSVCLAALRARGWDLKVVARHPDDNRRLRTSDARSRSEQEVKTRRGVSGTPASGRSSKVERQLIGMETTTRDIQKALQALKVSDSFN
eukprot:762614-Hanusia_phi.AAC.3